MERDRKLTALLCALILLLTAGCGAQKASADMQSVYEQMQRDLDMPEMIMVSEKRLVNVYGIDPETCVQGIFAVAADGLRVDEIWLIEARDDAAAEKLSSFAKSRAEQLCAETENYLPDQYKVAADARIVHKGRYVARFISPGADAMEKLFNSSIS